MTLINLYTINEAWDVSTNITIIILNSEKATVNSEIMNIKDATRLYGYYNVVMFNSDIVYLTAKNQDVSRETL